MLSIIIPFHNESKNIAKLIDEIKTTLKNEKFTYEVVLVNDGSTDDTKESLSLILKAKSDVKAVDLPRRMGKGEALVRGLKKSSGEIIVFMDGDLQDDPEDISRFYKTLSDEFDLVNGIRKNRKDNMLIKLYSAAGNYFLRFFVHSPFHDINCGFKMFRREILDQVVLYANNFRFLPIAAYYKGFKVAEIEVNNRPRLYGRSKFGITKPIIGFIDTLTAYFLYQFAERPLHFFGVIGGTFFFIGFIISFYLSYERLFLGVLLYRRPLLQFAILMIVIGIQIVMTGFIGELIVYVHKAKKNV